MLRSGLVSTCIWLLCLPISTAKRSPSIDVEMGFGPPSSSSLSPREAVDREHQASSSPPEVPPPATPPIEAQPLSTSPLLSSNKKTSLHQDHDVTPQDAALLRDVKQITRVNINTTKGKLELDVHFDWAPQGAAQFLSLVMSNFYDDCTFFRVVPGFVAQFGLNADPSIQSQYGQSIMDDVDNKISNDIGTVSFAAHGPNSRSTQVFINLMDNARLDRMGFTPFAKLTDASLVVASLLESRYGESPDQSKVQELGNDYLQNEFPLLDLVISGRVE